MRKEQGAPTCFVIMPIGPSGSRIRKRSAQLYQTVISPAAEQAGYAPIRADQLPGAGMIMTEIIRHLANDPLVIADLSGRNPNVYYELAVRHAVRKPVLGTVHAGEKLPFDISSLRVVEFDTQDPESMESARQRLSALIRKVESKAEGYVSPLGVALPAWTWSTPAGRIPSDVIRFIINGFLELEFLVGSPAMSPEPCSRCRQAHSLARQMEQMLDALADDLGIFGPSELREYTWKQLEIVKGIESSPS